MCEFRNQWLALILLVVPGMALSQFTLSAVEKLIEMEHRVPQMSVEQLRDRIAAGDSTIMLFDVRKPEEYRTSHLAGALRVDPGASADDFLEAHGDSLAGRKLVFYCSVGKRSSILAEQVDDDAVSAGASGVFNLRGGIFRWYNTGLPVVDDGGRADQVHPFDSYWGQLLEKRD